jgi:hypothetical protein
MLETATWIFEMAEEFQYSTDDRSAIYRAQHAAVLVAQLNEESKRLSASNALMQWPIHSLKNCLRPLRKSDIIAIHGMSHEMKSGLARWLEGQFMSQLLKSPVNPDTGKQRAIFVAHTEELTETHFMRFARHPGVTPKAVMMGTVEQAQLMQLEMRATGMPIFLIGEASGAESFHGKMPRRNMTLNRIRAAIAWAEQEWDVEPSLVTIDHMHDIAPDRGWSGDEGKDIRMVDADIFNFKLSLSCPVMIVAQDNAKDVIRRPPEERMPLATDMRYASQLYHRAAFIFGVHQPYRHLKGADISIPVFNGMSSDGTPNPAKKISFNPKKQHLLVQVQKARDSEFPDWMPLMDCLPQNRQWGDLQEVNTESLS